MSRKILLILVLSQALFACCAHPVKSETVGTTQPASLSEYPGIDISHFMAEQCGTDLDETYMALLDGMLSSEKKSQLTPAETEIFTSFTRDCRFFQQKSHGAAWLQKEHRNLDRLTMHEGNLKAAPLRREIDRLYAVNKAASLH